jgi:hypothetical protein
MLTHYAMPHLLSLAAAEDRILTLEDNMVRLRAELFTTKKTRNSFAPLCALPIEILRWILLNTQISTSAQDVKASRLGLHHFSFNDGWEEVILTCARIHEVSMSTPELWAYVDLSWTSSRISAYMVRAGTINMVLECTQRPWCQRKISLATVSAVLCGQYPHRNARTRKGISSAPFDPLPQ